MTKQELECKVAELNNQVALLKYKMAKYEQEALMKDYEKVNAQIATTIFIGCVPHEDYQNLLNLLNKSVESDSRNAVVLSRVKSKLETINKNSKVLTEEVEKLKFKLEKYEYGFTYRDPFLRPCKY